MSLLNVTVKKARYVGTQAAQFNTYVTLKLQNVKSTTVTVKGANPCWEQDFLFETNDLNTGLLIEVWSKGMIWDRAMGYHWIPLQGVQYANEGTPVNGGPDVNNTLHEPEDEHYDGSGHWLSLEAELVMRDGEVVGTKNPTGHSLLVDCRFELPFGRCDPPTGWQCILRETELSRTPVPAYYEGYKGLIDPENTEAADLQRKLEMLNNIMDQEARAEQARRQMQYFGHSGYSEDSDYTSDLNYPVGQHANSSASQFRAAAGQMHTPQRSLETSRENSYERDDIPNHHQHHLPPVPLTHQHHLSPGHAYHHSTRHHNSTSSPNHQRYSPNAEDYGYNTSEPGQNTSHQFNETADSEPLFYNSRPRNNYKQRYSSQDTWYSAEYGSTTGGFGQQQPSVDSVDAALGRSGYPGDTDYYGSSQPPSRRARGGTTTSGRRPSLERQTTLYDDQYYSTDNTSYYPSIEITDTREQTFNQSYDEYFDTSSYACQEERYGQDEEDRQWDSGGLYYNKTNSTSAVHHENHINKRRSSVLPQPPATAVTKNSTSSYNYQPTPPKKPFDDEPYPTTPTPSTTRRRIPQIPQKRSASRQGSLNDYDTGGYESCHTPDKSSARGASLPPTPTTTPKLLARLGTHAKPSVSLPPTPGRQLPKPNLNHRSAKARRNNLLKRTSSADYADIEQEDVYNSYYIRPGAASATQMYNEDYNYAYQSIDNLPAQPDEQTDVVPVTTVTMSISQNHQPSVVVNSERRTSLTLGSDLTIGVPNETLLGYQPPQTQLSAEEYYYSAQEDRDYQDEYEYEQQEARAAASRKKRLGRRGNSPLCQQNTDSLESRDDELKDSFETAVSSVSSSLAYQRQGVGYSEYSTAADTFSTSTTSVMPLVDSPQSHFTASVTATQYNRDQSEPPKAIVTVVNGASVRDNLEHTTTTTTTSANTGSSMFNSFASAFSAVSAATASAVAAVTNNARNNNANTQNVTNSSVNSTINGTANRQANRGYLKQQDSIDNRNYFKHQESLDEYEEELLEPVMDNDNYIKTDATDHYLNHQESIESYTEEAGLTNGSIIDEYSKGGKESPVSVIHVESYDQEANEKEEDLDVVGALQNQSNLIDPFHPSVQHQLDPYAPPASVRRPSIDPYRPVSPSRRTSADNYPGSRKSSVVDAYGGNSRKTSLDPYQPLSRRTSVIRHSPTPSDIHKQESIDQVTPTESVIVESEQLDEKKQVSFEEEEEQQQQQQQQPPQPRQQVTAKQRWHWAYNKIIMQLNQISDSKIAANSIPEFYANKTILITGATGYLGKVLIEKLLRSCSSLKEILIVIRPKKGKCVKERIEELRHNDIFKCVREIDINLLTKIQPLVGELTEDYLGLHPDDLEKVINTVDIFFHLGAAVNFEAPIKYLVEHNLTGVQNAINVAQKIKHLHAFINVSSLITVYNYGETEEMIYPTNISGESLTNITKNIDENILTNITQELRKKFINTYAYTKAAGDNLIQERCQNLQVGIFRPPGVGPLYKEPIPGWQDYINIVNGVCFGIANGTLQIMNIAPTTQMYIVPGDYTVNCIIAIAWEVANKPTGITVYNYTENYKMTAELMVKKCMNFKYPLEHCLRYPSTSMIPIQSDNLHNFLLFAVNALPAVIWDQIYAIFGEKYKYGKSIEKLNKILKTIGQLHKKLLIFDMNNSNNLWERMSPTDKEIFYFDLNSVNWDEYLDVMAYGLKTISLKEDMANINYAKMKYYWLMIQHYTWRFLFILAIGMFLLKKIRSKL